MDFKDKTILITGASNGIGREIAINLSNMNGYVIAADIDDGQGEELISEIRENNKLADYINFDISYTAGIKKIISDIISKYKKVDILINNAGICPEKHPGDIGMEEWDKVLNINLKAMYFLINEVSKSMIENKYGKIVNMSSVGAKIGGVNVGPHYVASKGGVEALTRYYAKNLAQYNINVNAVSPATTITKLNSGWSEEIIEEIKQKIPLNRLATVKDISNVVTFLASDESGFMTGEVVNVNGGIHMD